MRCRPRANRKKRRSRRKARSRFYLAEGLMEASASSGDAGGVRLGVHGSTEQLVGKSVITPAMAATDGDIAVSRVLPGCEVDELIGDFRVVRRAGDRVRDCSEKDVRAASFDVIDGGFNVAGFLTFITPQ